VIEADGPGPGPPGLDSRDGRDSVSAGQWTVRAPYCYLFGGIFASRKNNQTLLPMQWRDGLGIKRHAVLTVLSGSRPTGEGLAGVDLEVDLGSLSLALWEVFVRDRRVAERRLAVEVPCWGGSA
jgi:hypothetical protein